MKISEAKQFADRLSKIVHSGDLPAAAEMLDPLLHQRIPFTVTGAIGEIIGSGPINTTNDFLSLVADINTEGSWPLIGMALNSQLDRDFIGALDRCQQYIIHGDKWYCADTLSERVPGPALLAQFDLAIKQLYYWRENENAWVRRSVGVAIHFWAKRTKRDESSLSQMKQLLDLLCPMFTERKMDAVKGIGWGIKTLSRYYPDMVADWLIDEVRPQPKQYRSIMLSKAIKFLPPEAKNRVLASISS